MKTLSLVVLLALAGCRANDPKRVDLVELQIATLTSMALVGGERSPLALERIAADGAECRKNFRELAYK